MNAIPLRLLGRRAAGLPPPAPTPAWGYAARVFVATGRRTPEGAALLNWLRQCATSLGLDEADLPGDDVPTGRRSPGVPAEAWHGIGALLAAVLEDAPTPASSPATLWIEAFARTLGLDALEAAILGLGLHYAVDSRVERLADMVSEARGLAPHLSQDPAVLGMLAGGTPAEVEQRLAAGGRLLGTGLLRLDCDGDVHVVRRLSQLVRAAKLPDGQVYAQLLGKAAEPALPWPAFQHLGRPAEVAADVLRAAVAERAPGVHILLWGPPGTGKTTFAAALAAQAGAVLRPVVEADEHGDEPTRHERLAGLQLGQRLAPPGEALLFDEAEDLFRPADISQRERPLSRVFMHRLLERAPVPVVWTANDISTLGPAVLRRMTVCLELRVPDVATRTRLWLEMGASGGVPLSPADAGRLARLVPAAPAVASSALRAARLAGGGADTVRLVVEGVARAVAGGVTPAPEPDPDDRYDPALVQADQDLAALADALARPGADRAVSFLLHGPPGSGKSAWARHLAGRMGLPVMQKRASDLLAPFVGETEHRIAGAFAEARDAGAFLVFDEVDSLLGDRSHAVRSWEVSQVNEMLTWMESHPLPFACTTNLLDRVDGASLRRFLVKVRFGWLDPAQARQAFRAFFEADPPGALDGLPTLTPADFALVRRRAAVLGGADASALVRLLAGECEGRVGARGVVGFGGA